MVALRLKIHFLLKIKSKNIIKAKKKKKEEEEERKKERASSHVDIH